MPTGSSIQTLPVRDMNRPCASAFQRKVPLPRSNRSFAGLSRFRFSARVSISFQQPFRLGFLRATAGAAGQANRSISPERSPARTAREGCRLVLVRINRSSVG
jgi:hypothetical protein